MKPLLDPQPLPPEMPLLREWRRLSEAETLAIQSRDWAELDELQEAKCLVQSRMSAVKVGPRTLTLTVAIADLLSREAQNQNLLQSQMATARHELDSQAGTVKTIHGVRRAYGSQPIAGGSATCWQQYS